MTRTPNDIARIRDHWEEETCGIRYGDAQDIRTRYSEIRDERRRLEPWILPFQNAPAAAGRRVLEIGVGAGSDFLRWVEAGADATGIDLTNAAIRITREHLAAEGVDTSGIDLRVADAETLPFADGSFDLVYSYGVLHHTADTDRALREARRVLRPGGQARLMLYHRPCWTGWMLWAVHYALRGRPFVSVRRAIFEKLESPGTRSYTRAEARRAMRQAGFGDPRIETLLGPGDLLLIRPSRRYSSRLYAFLWKLYPRPLVRALGHRFGIIMLIEADVPR
ncbi:MAG: class I SAM-dependent methyltransferase [Ignavibacteria bacterium]|nr:class I SAM-dependent methyltransferase [Ignavibacteria bacterium]